jgi:DNA-binding CsgD family transcriptional regulator
MGQVLPFPDRIRADDAPADLPPSSCPNPLFVDWVTIRQVHSPGSLPRFTDGVVISLNADGVHQWQTDKRCIVEGSFDSRMVLLCDGTTVEYSGNISRWNRPDNVFGYSFFETIERINEFVQSFFLPPFTAGELTRYADSGWVWTGARLSRIDLTMNYFTGSMRNAQALLYKLASHHSGRQKSSVLPDQITCTWGYGSRYVSQKVYLKAKELEVHKKKRSGKHVDPQVIEWCKSIGMMREEITLKSRFLTQNSLAYLGAIKEDHLMSVYRARSQIKNLPETTLSESQSLSSAAAGTYSRWEKGEPLGLTRRTFYRHRQEILKKLGVDISIIRNVVHMKQPVQVIEVQPMVAPEWYRDKFG